MPAKPFPNTNSMYIGKGLAEARWAWRPWEKMPIELLWVLIPAQFLKNWWLEAKDCLSVRFLTSNTS